MTTLNSATSLALLSLQDLVVRGWTALRTGHLGIPGALILLMWVTGVTSDAVSTILMMRSGMFEEANGVAALGMNFVGLEVYTLLASLVCLALMVPTLVRPRQELYSLTFWVCLTLIGVVKVYTGGSNIFLALTTL